MIHARNAEGTIAAYWHGDRWPWICGHAIPADRDSCACGARQAAIVVEHQPVLEPARR